MPTDSEILTAAVEYTDCYGVGLELDVDLDVIEATLRKYAAIALAVESGEWKLVPVEATKDMQKAPEANDWSWYDSTEFTRDDAAQIYREMLAAAPQFQEEGK